jgi:hypothetical protein
VTDGFVLRVATLYQFSRDLFNDPDRYRRCLLADDEA